MPEKDTNDPIWADFEPDTFINESDIPSRSKDLTSIVNNWLSNHIGYVDPKNWEEVDKHFYRKQAFVELSSYLLNARGVAGEQPLPDVHNLIIDRVNGRYFPQLLSRSPRELHHFAIPFIYAEYVNELNEGPKNRLENVVETGAFQAAERVPYRQIEYWFILRCFSRLFGPTPDKYDEREALENSVLNYQPNMVRCMLPDAYCITHNIFFYDNYYGIFPEIFPADQTPFDLEPLLRGLILRFMADGNTDIVLELVCAGVLERKISRQMVQLVLSWLFENITQGYVPGPTFDKTDLLKSLDVVEDSMEVKPGNAKPDYENDREEEWIKNFHTNVVAGMTARIIERDWGKIESKALDYSFAVDSTRRDITRIGQLLNSLSSYDLMTGARQMKRLAQSPVIEEYETASQDAIDFLREQQTIEGKYGFWPKEEIIFTNSGKSFERFDSQLRKPVSKACREALGTFEDEVDPIK